MNIGEDAAQLVFYFHIHIITRKKGDIDNPKGWIMGVIPHKKNTNRGHYGKKFKSR